MNSSNEIVKLKLKFQFAKKLVLTGNRITSATSSDEAVTKYSNQKLKT